MQKPGWCSKRHCREQGLTHSAPAWRQSAGADIRADSRRRPAVSRSISSRRGKLLLMAGASGGPLGCLRLACCGCIQLCLHQQWHLFKAVPDALMQVLTV